MVFKKQIYFSFFILVLIILINKNIFAAPLCLEEENNIENAEIIINDDFSREGNSSIKIAVHCKSS